MSSALLSGLSGLQTSQQALNIIGNNLANANTTGFKSQSINFSDLLYQTLSPGTGGSGALGGTNPVQTGFGVQSGSVDTNQTQGSLNPTGNNLDMGIQGGGFFVVNNGSSDLYTRSGAFGVDQNNYLVDPATGDTVQRFGTVGEGGNGTQAFQVVGDDRIKIPYGSGTAGQVTSNVTLAGNLDATATPGTQVNSAIQIYDTQGTAHTLSLVFTNTAANTWSLTPSLPSSQGTVSPATINGITFGNDGSFQGPANPSISFTITSPNPLPAQNLSFNLGTVGGFNGLTQFGSASSAAATTQNGFGSGFLNTISITTDGTVNGVFSNGQTLPLAQVALAAFQNPGGLLRQGSNYYAVTSQSGNALIGAAQSGARGAVDDATLEQSNVDASQQMTQLIIAQQGFEMNARTISVENQVIQTLTQIIQ